jgi:hypothetical protein
MKKLLAAFLLAAATQSLAADPSKVVYHVNDPERLPFALTNIANHLRAAGPGNVEIVLVTHGPVVAALQKDRIDPKIADALAGLRKQKVEFDACGNTLNNLKLGVNELADGFIRVDAGVLRIAELQGKGYVYIRP